MDAKGNINEYRKNNKNLIPIIKGSKNPAIKKWTDRITPDHELEAHNGNFGWALGAHDLIIDVDTKSFTNNSYEKLLKRIQIRCNTISFEKTVNTPSGGYHIYLKLPEGVDSSLLKKTLSEFPGIDFLKKGNQALIPGSVTENGMYTWADDKKKFFVQEAPNSLIATLKDNRIVEINEDGSVFRPYSTTIVKKYLSMITDGEYETWYRVCLALKDWCVRANRTKIVGLQLFLEWSKGVPNYESDYAVHKKWETVGKNKSITQGTLKVLAEAQSGIVVGASASASESRVVGKNYASKYGDSFSYWAYINSRDEYFNFKRFLSYTEKQFNRYASICVPVKEKENKQGNHDPEMTPTQWVNKNQDALIDYEYSESAPDEKERVFLNHEGFETLNTFDSRTIPAPAGRYTQEGMKAIEKLDAHLELIMGTKEDALIFKQWMAHNRQFPGSKLKWIPIIQGSHGTGKSYLGCVITAIMGGRNVKEVGHDSISSGFSAWAEGYSVVILSEFKISGQERHTNVDRLKQKIADPNVEINKKGKDPINVKNRTNYVAFTNNKDSIPLTGTERRYWFINSPVLDEADLQKKIGGIEPYIYFNELFGFLEDPEITSQFIKHYVEFPISQEFLNMKTAPKNEAFRRALATEEASFYGLAELKELINEGDDDYYEDVVFSSTLKAHLLARLEEIEKEEYRLKAEKNGDDVDDFPDIKVRDVPMTVLLKKLNYQKWGTLRKDGIRQSAWTKLGEELTSKDLHKMIDDHRENFKEKKAEREKEKGELRRYNAVVPPGFAGANMINEPIDLNERKVAKLADNIEKGDDYDLKRLYKEGK